MTPQRFERHARTIERGGKFSFTRFVDGEYQDYRVRDLYGLWKSAREGQDAPDEEDDDSLKPCPFCGGQAEMGENDDGANFIECKKCGGSTNLQYSLKDDGRPQLIERWNSRAKATRAEARVTVEQADKL